MHCRTLIQVIGVSIAIQSLALVVPGLAFLVVDEVVRVGSEYLLSWVVPGVCFVALAEASLRLSRERLLASVRGRFEEELTIRLVRRLAEMPVRWFERTRVSEWLSRVRVCRFIVRFVVERASAAFIDALLSVVSLAFVAIWSWRLALVSAALVLLFVTASVVACAVQLVLVRKRRVREQLEESGLVRLLGGLASVRACGNVLAAVDRWGLLLRGRIAAAAGRNHAGAAFSSGLAALHLFAVGVSVAVGAAEVIDEALTAGVALALVIVVIIALERVRALMAVLRYWPEAYLQLERLEELLSSCRAESRPLIVPSRTAAHDLVFDRVCFRYGDGAWVFRDFSVWFEAGGLDDGRVVAVVGSQCGKSTMARLIAGLCLVEEGQITYAGVPLQLLDRRECAGRCAVVLEDGLLFAGTVSENVSLGRSRVRQEDVVEACRVVELHREVTDMPLQYDTPVFDAGAGLSGSQRSRLLLARALVSQPALVVIDELLMRIGVRSAARILARMRGRVALTVILGDRVALARHADEIFVLRDGRLAERGTHDSLIRAGGLYADFARDQAVENEMRV